MLVKIVDGIFTAIIDTVGAEIKSFSNGADEIIWPGTPAIWDGSAPILFPVIGRLKNGGYDWRGRHWEMPKHGLVRKQEWPVIRQKSDHAIFRTVANDFTRTYYPGEFIFDVEFRIVNNTLTVSYEITNTDVDELLFSVGSHPGINLPLANTCLEDYYLELNREENCPVHRLTSSGLLATRSEKTLCGKIVIPLTEELFRDDALFLLGINSDVITVGNRRTGRRVAVHTGGVPDLGLWAKPGAPYVCIEPWFGYDDLENHDGIFEHKPGIKRLVPGEHFTCTYSIQTFH